jgi:hypothetical protein
MKEESKSENKITNKNKNVFFRLIKQKQRVMVNSSANTFPFLEDIQNFQNLFNI